MQRIRNRVLRALRKAGKWVDLDAAADSDDGAGAEVLAGLPPRRWKGAPRSVNGLASGIVASVATVGGSRW